MSSDSNAPVCRPATPASKPAFAATCSECGAEGAYDFGHVRLGGIGQTVAEAIEARTGFEARMTNLGHILRGGTPSAFDRVLATRFGIGAIDAVHDGDFGKMVTLRGADIVRVPLADAVAELKTVDPAFFSVAEVFFG